MLTRRDLLAAGAGTGAAWMLAPTATTLGKPRLARGGAFPTGVASGVPQTNGALLWTRVDGIAPRRAARLELEVAADPDFRRVLHRERPLALPVRDHTVKRVVRGKRFKPGEQYWYRFSTASAESPVGRFRTALPADSAEPVRIGFFSCQKWHQGYYTAHAGLAAEPDLDLVVCLGDYVYEEPTGDQEVPERSDRTGVNADGDVQTLDEYRQKYRLYKSDRDLMAMHAAHPVAAVWDDHEAEDDYAGENEGDNRRPRRVPFLERRRAGYLSYFEYLPVVRRRDDPFRIYGSARLGGVELFALDTRQYRDALACPSVTPCPQGSAPGRSILGPAQRAWLMDGLAASQATWKVLVNQVMLMGLDVPAGSQINADQWDGYADERRILMQHVLDRGIKDVTTVTGDIHTFFAGTVTTSGRSDGTPAATEFVGGSITSVGIARSVRDRGIAASDEQVQTFLRANNPHIAYVGPERRGYGILEARPDELRVTFRSPTTVLEPRSEVEDLAKFRVARGSTQVETA